MSEEVIDLSIGETNKLRKELGLKPLVINNNNNNNINNTTSNARHHPSSSSSSNAEEQSISIQESNALRSSLGLPPLRTSAPAENGRKSSTAIHAPPQNTQKESLVKERIMEAKLKREVQAGIRKLQKEAEDKQLEDPKEEEALTWAERMRQTSAQPITVQKNTSRAPSSTPSNAPSTTRRADNARSSKKQDYTDSEFEQQNLTVDHNTSDFEMGSTTVLTLKDKSILEAEEDLEEGNELINVNLAESLLAKDNLKRKRMMEMGTGHAGGYAGYDDDEFEELGGTQAMTLGINHSNKEQEGLDHDGKEGSKSGFKLAGRIENVQEREQKDSDLFASLKGRSVSLVSDQKEGVHQTDFMSYEEEAALGLGGIGYSKEEMEKRRKKKEKKLMKKLKKENRSRKEREIEGADDDHDEIGEDQVALAVTASAAGKGMQGSSLIEELQASSNTKGKKRRQRKRRRDVDSDDSEDDGGKDSEPIRPPTESNDADAEMIDKDETIKDETMQQTRKNKFHSIMEKGNQRSQAVFQSRNQENEKRNAPMVVTEDFDEVDDDAFLSAAISKARRLRRLRELNADNKGDLAGVEAKGANAVVQALKSIEMNRNKAKLVENDSGKITFELGTTKEFTRALRAQPVKQDDPKNAESKVVSVSVPVSDSEDAHVVSKMPVEVVSIEETEKDENENHQTLEELADQVEEDSGNAGAFESTESAVGVGRGMSAFLGMLKQTGEVAGKSAGKEELRGRAKDEKTYDDYAPLDLKKVVKIDTTDLRGRPHEKDVELANREVKLEYRDDHGRLLTRKEAYRQLCYQFHGHGSSKRNEEKRLQQIEREQAERSANNGISGTLGALKATQKATGKAFVLHKT
jgi:U4/U6.U5 tri-snRNP-associated protein 1